VKWTLLGKVVVGGWLLWAR